MQSLYCTHQPANEFTQSSNRKLNSLDFYCYAISFYYIACQPTLNNTNPRLLHNFPHKTTTRCAHSPPKSHAFTPITSDIFEAPVKYMWYTSTQNFLSLFWQKSPLEASSPKRSETWTPPAQLSCYPIMALLCARFCQTKRASASESSSWVNCLKKSRGIKWNGGS